MRIWTASLLSRPKYHKNKERTVFLITLTLTEKKAEAAAHMELHNAWISKGFEDGMFILVGSLQPQGGGAILAISSDRSEVEERVAADPFVREGIVTAHIQEIVPGRTDQRLSFLKEPPA